MQLDHAPARILVRAPNWVGDAVMATPALRALRTAFPRSEISLLGRRLVLRLLAGLRSVDHAVALPPGKGPSALLSIARMIRKLDPELALVLPNSHFAVLPVWLARVPIRVGYLRRRAFFLTDGLRSEWEGERRKPVPMPSYYLALAALVGADASDESLELAITPDEESAAAELRARLGLRDGERYAALNPGASFGTSKLWRADRFAALAGEIHRRHGWRSLVLCGPGEEELAHEIAGLAGPAAIDTSTTPVSLELLKPVMRDAELLVTTDTGPRHIATAFARPTVVIMGPTDPRYTASNLEQTVVVREDVFCGPCHKKICDLDHRCMEWIDVPRVVRAIDYVLGLADTLAPPRRAPTWSAAVSEARP
jgi:heptosyltransferase-2